MKRIKWIVALTGILLATGCIVPSIYPLYNDDTLTFDPALLGTWVEEGEEGVTWVFRQTSEQAYEFVHTDEDSMTGVFQAHLVCLGDDLFLDLYPDRSTLDDAVNGFFLFHLVPAHSFLRVWLEEETLRLAIIDLEWLKNGIENGSVTIDHVYSEDQIILTAETIQLQQFVHQHKDEAFDEPVVLRHP